MIESEVTDFVDNQELGRGEHLQVVRHAVLGEGGFHAPGQFQGGEEEEALTAFGTTHLAQAIGYEAIKQGFTVGYRSIFDLVRDFLAEDALQQRDRVLQAYLKADLLIIDDMGLRALPKHSGEYLLEVIMRH